MRGYYLDMVFGHVRYHRFDLDFEVSQAHLLIALLLNHLKQPRVVPVHDAGELELVHAREQYVSFLRLYWVKEEFLRFSRLLSEVAEIKV